MEEVIITCNTVGKVEPLKYDVYFNDHWGEKFDRKPDLRRVSMADALLALGQHSGCDFKITQTGKPSQVFLTGICHAKSMASQDGRVGKILGFSSMDKVDDLKTAIRKVGY